MQLGGVRRWAPIDPEIFFSRALDGRFGKMNMLAVCRDEIPAELLAARPTDLDTPAGNLTRRPLRSCDRASHFCAPSECRQGGDRRDPRRAAAIGGKAKKNPDRWGADRSSRQWYSP